MDSSCLHTAFSEMSLNSDSRHVPELLNPHNQKRYFPFSELPIEIQMEIAGYLDHVTIESLSKVCYSMKDTFRSYLSVYPNQLSALVNFAVAAGRIDQIFKAFKKGNTIPLHLEFMNPHNLCYSDFIRLLKCFPSTKALTFPSSFEPSKIFKIINQCLQAFPKGREFFYANISPSVPKEVNDSAIKMALTKCQRLYEMNIPSGSFLSSEVFNDIPLQPSMKVLSFQFGFTFTNKTLHAIFQKFTLIKKLSINSATFVQKSQELSDLGVSNSLRIISLANVDGFNDQDLKVLLDACPSLKKIFLKRCLGITQQGLSNLKKHPTLKKVGLFQQCLDSDFAQREGRPFFIINNDLIS